MCDDWFWWVFISFVTVQYPVIVCNPHPQSLYFHQSRFDEYYIRKKKEKSTNCSKDCLRLNISQIIQIKHSDLIETMIIHNETINLGLCGSEHKYVSLIVKILYRVPLFILNANKTPVFSCLLLIIVRGAQLSPAPLMTLFPHNAIDLFCQGHSSRTIMYISESAILSESSLLIWSLRWKWGKTELLPGEQPTKWLSIWLIVVIKVMKKDSAPYCSAALFHLSQLCQHAHKFLSLETLPSWYCSAFCQLLTELMHYHWNSSGTFKAFVSPSTCLWSA